MTAAVSPPLGGARGGGEVAGRGAWTPLLGAALALEIALTVAAVRAPAGTAVVAAALAAGVAVIAAAHLLLPAAEREPLLVLTGAGLLVRVAVLLAAHHAAIGPGNPHGFLVPDSFGYDRTGWDLAQHWRHGASPRLAYHTAGLTIGYHYLVAGIYAVGGHVPLLAKAVNALLGASLVPLTFLLGKWLAGRRAGFVAAFLAAVWPPLVYWSVQLVKDIAVAFLLLVAVLGWVAFARRPRLTRLAAALLPAWPLLFLRSYIAVFWMLGVAAGLLAVAARSRRPLLAIALLVTLVVAGGYWAPSEHARWVGSRVPWYVRMDIAGPVPGSIFEEVQYRSLRDVLLLLPLGAMRFLLAPLPWKTYVVQWPEAIGSVLRYALLPFAVLGLAHLLRVKRAAMAPVLVCGFLTVVLYAVTFRGGVPRHLIQFYPYFVVLAAAGLPRWPNWPLPLALGWTAFLAAALALGRA